MYVIIYSSICGEGRLRRKGREEEETLDEKNGDLKKKGREGEGERKEEVRVRSSLSLSLCEYYYYSYHHCSFYYHHYHYKNNNYNNDNNTNYTDKQRSTLRKVLRTSNRKFSKLIISYTYWHCFFVQKLRQKIPQKIGGRPILDSLLHYRYY